MRGGFHANALDTVLLRDPRGERFENNSDVVAAAVDGDRQNAFGTDTGTINAQLVKSC